MANHSNQLINKTPLSILPAAAIIWSHGSPFVWWANAAAVAGDDAIAHPSPFMHKQTKLHLHNCGSTIFTNESPVYNAINDGLWRYENVASTCLLKPIASLANELWRSRGNNNAIKFIHIFGHVSIFLEHVHTSMDVCVLISSYSFNFIRLLAAPLIGTSTAHIAIASI